jgi:hypothetical protein
MSVETVAADLQIRLNCQMKYNEFFSFEQNEFELIKCARSQHSKKIDVLPNLYPVEEPFWVPCAKYRTFYSLTRAAKPLVQNLFKICGAKKGSVSKLNDFVFSIQKLFSSLGS